MSVGRGIPYDRVPVRPAEVAGRVGAVREWVAGLPETIGELAERWALRVGEPYEPGGECAWVAPAWDARGTELVLKVGWRHPEAEHEADALRLWNGRGAVRLHAAHASGSTSALLLERCVPGTTLGASLPEQERHPVVADLLCTLWTTPPPGHPFRPLREMCEMWADGFEAALPGARIDPGLAREALTIFRTFPESCSVEVLLCTDLHAGNILASRRDPWLAVDPKPYVGDPAYDVTQHMLNCDKQLLADPIGLTHRMADLLGLDPARVRAWQFARCVMESRHDRTRYETALRLAP